ARGAFGSELVPDWSKDAKTIAADWSDSVNEMYRLQEAQAAALPKADDANEAVEDVVRRELTAARWGWLSGVDEQDLRAALDEVTRKIIGTSHPELPLSTVTRNGKTIYLLVSEDRYGQNDQALPK
ncbi:MAG: hypothetical protein KGJ80_17800, partial [Chloroflexota bacterium]|nr:hypothetical protein [Chloroflexota bacterium]